MKNIIVYIAIFVLTLPGLSLTAEVNIQTNHLFDDSYMPFNNDPFAGENPTKIKRNLNVKNQYKFDFNHNNLHNNHRNERVSHLKNDKIEYNANTTTNISYQKTEIRRYNTPLNNNTETVVTYNMPSAMRTSSIEAFATNESQNTTPSEENNYQGSGAPSEYKVPVGDAMLPFMLLLASLYFIILRYKK